MAQTASVVAQIFTGFLSATDTGVSNSVATLAADSGIPLAPIPSAYIVAQNMAIDIFEKSSVVKYPLVQVYSDRVRN